MHLVVRITPCSNKVLAVSGLPFNLELWNTELHAVSRVLSMKFLFLSTVACIELK